MNKNPIRLLVESIAEGMNPVPDVSKHVEYPKYKITYISYTDDANFFSDRVESVVDERAIELLRDLPWYCATGCEFEGTKYPQNEDGFNEFKRDVMVVHDKYAPIYQREQEEKAAEYERLRKQADDDYIGSKQEKLDAEAREIAMDEWRSAHGYDDDDGSDEEEENGEDEE